MSGLIDKRKRSREDDFCCESTPLSKRINNLHLTNFEEAHSSHNNNNTIKHDMLPKMLFTEQQTIVPVHMPHLKPPVGVVMMDSFQYNPELDETQNPYYYMKNKLLHELHLERLKRCSI